MNKNTIPIIVITQSDGAILLDILDTHGDNVEARLDAESDLDTLVGGGRTGTAVVLSYGWMYLCMYTVILTLLSQISKLYYRIAGNFRGVNIRYFRGQADLHEI